MKSDATSGEHEDTEQAPATGPRPLANERESDRYRLAAKASSSLLLAVVAFAMAIIFGGAAIVGQVIGKERVVTPLAVAAAIALPVGVVLLWGYRREAAALRAFNRDYPRV